MPAKKAVAVEGVHPLPPLILHPFTEASATAQVLESAKSSLSLLRGSEGSPDRLDELERRMLDGRYTEFRMLLYVGKDLFRWMEQCVDACSRDPELLEERLPLQCFAQLLIQQTPHSVAGKLKSWGVVEYTRIFSRSIGIYCQFREPPPIELLQDGYLRHYFRYADYHYAAWRDSAKFPILPGEQFPFALYASGEYTKMLEEQWRDAL